MNEVKKSLGDSNVREALKNTRLEHNAVAEHDVRVYYDEYVKCPACGEKVRAGKMHPIPEPLKTPWLGFSGLMLCLAAVLVLAFLAGRSIE